jgi:glycosyltransferase involved in cell wall biosynthesis
MTRSGAACDGETALISVVIPCYNTERYIAEAIESIFAQRIEHVQVIVIDDGSTDRSAEIARSFGERVICRSQPNGGIAMARNAGVALAHGRYLAFLDADDIWTEGSLALRHRYLRQHNECVFGGVETFISPELSAQQRAEFGDIPPARVARFTGTMLIEKAAFDRVGPFDPALNVGEMFDWCSRAEQKNIAITLIDDIVLRRRIHGGNTVLRLKDRQTDYLKALRSSLARRREAAQKPVSNS